MDLSDKSITYTHKCINHVSSSFLFVLIKFEVMYVEYWKELSEETAHSSACCWQFVSDVKMYVFGEQNNIRSREFYQEMLFVVINCSGIHQLK